MGRLITLNDIHHDGLDPSWYFEDAQWSGSSGKYRFKWPSANFPFMAAIPYDTLHNDIPDKVKIRKWIEENTNDTVILDSIDNSYRKYHGKNYRWEDSWEVRNRWYRFHFDNDHCRLAFSIAFADIVKPLTAWRPDHPEDEEIINEMNVLKSPIY